MIRLARRIAHSRVFQTFIMGVILVNAALVGLETDPELGSRIRCDVRAVNGAIIAMFVVELTHPAHRVPPAAAPVLRRRLERLRLRDRRARCCRLAAASRPSPDWHACCAFYGSCPSS